MRASQRAEGSHRTPGRSSPNQPTSAPRQPAAGTEHQNDVPSSGIGRAAGAAPAEGRRAVPREECGAGHGNVASGRVGRGGPCHVHGSDGLARNTSAPPHPAANAAPRQQDPRRGFLRPLTRCFHDSLRNTQVPTDSDRRLQRETGARPSVPDARVYLSPGHGGRCFCATMDTQAGEAERSAQGRAEAWFMAKTAALWSDGRAAAVALGRQGPEKPESDGERAKLDPDPIEDRSAQVVPSRPLI